MGDSGLSGAENVAILEALGAYWGGAGQSASDAISRCRRTSPTHERFRSCVSEPFGAVYRRGSDARLLLDAGLTHADSQCAASLRELSRGTREFEDVLRQLERGTVSDTAQARLADQLRAVSVDTDAGMAAFSAHCS